MNPIEMVKNNMFVTILFLSGLVSFPCSRAYSSSVNDFCVADLKGPDSPSGYHCKPQDTVTTDDFVSSFSNGPTAFVTDMPGLNGLGVSAARLDLPPGGNFPMHTHPGASELLIVEKGQVTAGFLDSKKAFVKLLNPGGIIVFPRGLQHFFVNSGKENAIVIAFYNTPSPTFQYVTDQLFANNVSSPVIARATGIDAAMVRNLKRHFGGSG